MSNYITEAFKQLNLLEDMEEVKDISLDASGVDELRSFLDDAAVDPDEEMIDVYDLQAEAEEDLQKSYEGKVILECTVCHSHIFEDPENISIAEDGKACMDLECPYCMSNEGYYIIGEVAPYSENAGEEPVEDAELDEVDIEGAADVIDDEDIIEESCNTKKLKEDWDEEFEDEYDSIMNDDSLTEADKDKALKKLYAYYGMNESMKLDGVEELYDNDDIRGVEELEGSDKMEGSDAIRGDKHKAPINEDAYGGGGDAELVEASHSRKSITAVAEAAFEGTNFKNVTATKEKGGVRVDFDKRWVSEQTADSLAEKIEAISGDSRISVDPSVIADTYIIFDVTYLTESLAEGLNDVYTFETELTLSDAYPEDIKECKKSLTKFNL